MSAQNKSLYTRRFNQLKKLLQQHYDSHLIDFNETASLRWGPESCLVAHDGSLGFSMLFRDELTGELTAIVSIVKTPTCYTGGLVGIFVQETDLEHLIDCIDSALRDGFESIYVRSIGKVA